MARKLLERGHKLRALVRPGSQVRGLEVETVTGDLREPGSLEKAVSGCGAVFHVAADYRLWSRDSSAMYRSNVDGTRNILSAAQRSGVERVVYTSTVGCIGFPKGKAGDEGTPVGIEDMRGAYKRSKFLAEQTAIEFASAGMPVVIVNPTAPVGDHDFKPTPTGRIIVDFLRGGMPAYLDTGLNVVDADDVAVGHIQAYERGKSGDRYILGGQNMTLQDIFRNLESISGTAAPKVRIPYAVAYIAGAASTGWAYVTGVEPRAPLDGVRMARKKMWVSWDKAAAELGYFPGPAEEGLRKAVHWFLENGYC